MSEDLTLDSPVTIITTGMGTGGYEVVAVVLPPEHVYKAEGANAPEAYRKVIRMMGNVIYEGLPEITMDEFAGTAFDDD